MSVYFLVSVNLFIIGTDERFGCLPQSSKFLTNTTDSHNKNKREREIEREFVNIQEKKTIKMKKNSLVTPQ